MRKRILCMLMALCMIASLLPFTAAAADIVDSGKCGDNVTWTLDSDGLLTISGTGKMADYEWNNSPFGPFGLQFSIRSVIIEPGVNTVGSHAFYTCSNLTSVVIPDSVTNIGDSAFAGCTSLSGILFPNQLKYIGSGAFSDCASIQKAVIPDTIVSIENYTFRGCTKLINISIPDSVTTIGDAAFENCSSLSRVIIPDSVANIGYCAFAGCESLESVQIPDSVAEIKWKVFSGCISLTNVTLPDNWSSIPSELFEDCTGLTNVIIPNSIEGIGGGAFKGCTGLTSIVIPERVNFIGSSAFEGCVGLSKITIPDNDTWIADAAFKDCTSLKEIRNLDNAKIYGNESITSCFQGCTQLKSISVGEINGEKVFQGCTALEQVTTYRTKELEAYVFGNCPSLKEVYVSKTLESVKANAFRGATGLTDVYYEGTQEDWNKIQISKTGNDPLLNARIHFNWNVISYSPFEDVMYWDNAYYYKPVLWALRHQPQITNGTSDTTFSPEATCTRGQVVTFIWRAMGCPEPKSTANPFRDVAPSDYFYKAVLWANENGITNGTTPTTFGSNDPCTRAHVVTFLWRAHGSPAAGSANPFTDVPAGQYYTDAVLWAVSKNITNGTSANTFSPDSPCTRGQIVTFLYRDMK